MAISLEMPKNCVEFSSDLKRDRVKAVVVKPYERPYENPLAVTSEASVVPDFEKRTDIEGWV